MTDVYEKWLKAELAGYPEDSVEFYSEFSSEAEGNAWLDDCASHRFIKTYVKLIEPGQSVIQDVPFSSVFIRYPVREIARMIDSGRASGSQEFNIPWRSVAPEHYASMMSYFEENVPEARLSADFRAFFSIAALEQSLDGVRTRVLSLLADVRQQMRRGLAQGKTEPIDGEKLRHLKELAGELVERVGGFGPIDDEYEELSLKTNEFRNEAGRFRYFPKLAQAIRDMHNTVAWIMHNQRIFETRQEHDEVMHELEENYWGLIEVCDELIGN